MQTLQLPGLGRETTRLGFGCGSVMGVLGRRDSLFMLETAYEAGIRHYDVAPAYGYGEAEACLGEFLARHHGQLTVTSKFGIPAANARTLKGVARKISRPLLRSLPQLQSLLPTVSAAVAHTDTTVSGPNPIFTGAQARQSVEASLVKLRVDRIDLLLLHEARAMDLTDDSLLRTLQDLVSEGKIGEFGVGSEEGKIPALLAERPAYCRVLQYEWSILHPTPTDNTAFRIHHRALTRRFDSIHTALAEDTERCVRWSAECGVDLADPDQLASLLLKAALLCNPHSLLLFSSKRPGHIARNAALASSNTNDEAAMQLCKLVRAEMSTRQAPQSAE